ncbi:hypothetical protein SAMN05421505_110136 [Sinosporangium album]|uniref:Uncharacterized protein n=1 Tax=Sinosporangium album TaxID=504805 RepID=A0A1G7Z0N0_9ACTN|nr:hypothetical protein [Sinosporangium album]SDH02147.1 hypothetical protein SAMN05421505_110136 [Sinosporangium album]
MNAAKALLVTPALLIGFAVAPEAAAAAPGDSRIPSLSTGCLKPAVPRGTVREDRPPLGGNAVKGLHIGYLPKGFTLGTRTSGKHEYGYAWTNARDDTDRARRALWVRVVCSPHLKTLTSLAKLPVDIGTFTRMARPAEIGGRKVLVRKGDGALGPGTYLGWIERPGMAVTVMASPALKGHLNRIVKGIKATKPSPAKPARPADR